MNTQNSDGPKDPSSPPQASYKLWFMGHSYLSAGASANLSAFKSEVDTAAAAGYTGMMWWDSTLSYVHKTGWDSTNLRIGYQYALSKGFTVVPEIFPFGYSNEILQADPNFAEAQRVVGSTFKVIQGSSGLQLRLVNSLSPLQNTGFESGMTGWFGMGDSRLAVDSSVFHTGNASGVIRPGSSNARFVQGLNVIPWRTYHVQFFLKTSGLTGGLAVKILDFNVAPGEIVERLDEAIPFQPTQNWTQIDFVFNSQDSTQVNLYLGNWDLNAGQAWLDDVTVEETALVNIVRRAGTPVKIYDPQNPTNMFNEGSDVAIISDPLSGNASGYGSYDAYHGVPSIVVPAGSRLQINQLVAIDHYTVIPVEIGAGGGFQVGACLTDTGVMNWARDNFAALAKIFPPGTAYMLGYDEMRHMNSCGSCRQMGMSAGQLLAWHVQQMVSIIHGVQPGAPIYVWNDMFDPYHNAHDHYYHVEGNLSGSWANLTSDITIFNWNLGNLAASLGFFAGLDAGYPTSAHNQIIAGYYDNSSNPAGQATYEMSAAKGIRNITGQMYTTWSNDYGANMALYGQAALQAWQAHLQGN